MQPKFRINRITGLEIDRGTKILHRHTDRHTHTHTHRHTHRHTHTQTHTHTDTPAAYLISLFFLSFKKETRLKMNVHRQPS